MLYTNSSSAARHGTLGIREQITLTSSQCSHTPMLTPTVYCVSRNQQCMQVLFITEQ